jgi:hypothetical protein
VAAIRAELLTQAEVVTPNVPEAEVLTGLAIRTLDDMRAAARRIRALGPRVVVVKGGTSPPATRRRRRVHARRGIRPAGPGSTRAHARDRLHLRRGDRAYLALGQPVDEALRRRARISKGPSAMRPVWGRARPLNHFWRLY